MVEQIRTEFIGFSSTIETEGRQGNIQVFTDVQGMPVTDKELAELRRLQKEAAAKVDEVMNGKYISKNQDTRSCSGDEVREMAEQIRIKFIGFSSTIEKEGRQGDIQVFTHIQDMPITDKELAELRRLQKEAAAKVDEMINGK